MFGTSGIRGIVGKEISCELAQKLGRALASMSKKIVLARDTRDSGEMLANAFTSSALASGSEVYNIGIAPTPTLALSTRKYGCAGVMITASHNPPEYNGFKLFFKGREFSRIQEREISERIEKGNFASADWNSVGKEYKVSDALWEHRNLVLSLINTKLIGRKNPKILIDCGNGAASVLMPYLLREAGCRVVSINSEPSGKFSRGLEPNKENLEKTCKLVRAVKADLGIAHDGDADRAIIIDEKGEMVGLDTQLALMCEEILRKKKGAIVTTVEASLSVRETIRKNGGKIYITPVGSLYVAEEVAKRRALFGGEPCGEYIFPEGIPAPDGILTGLKFVELFCMRGKLSALSKRIKKYPILRAKFECAKKYEAVERMKSELKGAFKGEKNERDGIRIDGKDYWLLVRPSGTEPIVRLTCEAKNKKKLEEIFESAREIIKRNI